jgi:ferredoxin--NADP+ reductase
VVLVHGVREAQHLAYSTEIASLSASNQGRLSYLPIVSRQSDAEGLLHGRVTTALESGALEQKAALTLSPEHSHVMLCGNPAMINEMSERLAARGLRRHRQRKPGHVTSERFWE